MRALVEGQVWIPKDDLGPEAVRYLKRKLTIKPRKAPGYGDPDEKPEPVLCWTENEAHPDMLGVPRDFFFETAGKDYELEWNLVEGERRIYESCLKQEGPYAEQGQAIDELLAWLEGYRTLDMAAGRHLGAILKADPGFGKTNTALALTHRVGRTAVILVHKERLMMQWKRRAERFLPGVRVGLVREDKCDFEDKDLVIAMMQSIGMERFGPRYPQEFYDWPGLLLVDEGHRIGSGTWAPIPPMFRARWRLLLTATPRRKDGAEKVFWWHVGRIRYDAKTERPKPAVRLVSSRLERVPRVLKKHGISSSIVINILTKLTDRNRVIVREIVKALSAPSERKVLVLSERLEQIRELDEMLAAECRRVALEGITTGFYVGQWFTGEKAEKLARGSWDTLVDGGRERAIKTIFTSFSRRRQFKGEKLEDGDRRGREGDRVIYLEEDGTWLNLDAELREAEERDLQVDPLAVKVTPLDEYDDMLFSIAKGYDIKQKITEKRRDLTEQELEDAERARVVFMTYQMCSEGIDIPAADTLGFASPISDIEQSYGRGRRECVPIEHGGDKTPEDCGHYCPWKAGRCPGKPSPIAFDIVDPLVTLSVRRQRYREEFYREVGAKVRNTRS